MAINYDDDNAVGSIITDGALLVSFDVVTDNGVKYFQ
jgi:hypothetical protein